MKARTDYVYVCWQSVFDGCPCVKCVCQKQILFANNGWIKSFKDLNDFAKEIS